MTAYLTNLGGFWLLLLGIVLVPGMDMAIIVGSTLAWGRRAGTLALAGVVTASMVHVLVAVLGVSVILIQCPALLHMLLAGGGLYLGWIGIQTMSAQRGVTLTKTEPARHAVFRRAALTNLSNPKAYFFALAVIPQFLRPAWGKVPLQVGVLALLIVVTQVGVYGTFALFAERAHRSAMNRPSVARGIQKTIGAAFVLAALWLLVELARTPLHGVAISGAP